MGHPRMPGPPASLASDSSCVGAIGVTWPRPVQLKRPTFDARKFASMPLTGVTGFPLQMSIHLLVVSIEAATLGGSQKGYWRNLQLGQRPLPISFCFGSTVVGYAYDWGKPPTLFSMDWLEEVKFFLFLPFFLKVPFQSLRARRTGAMPVARLCHGWCQGHGSLGGAGLNGRCLEP